MAEKLSGEARKSALARLKGWREVAGRDAITRKFVFKDFNEAFGFMARAALVGKSSTITRNGPMSTKPSM
jgi:4a-hydroxytetrahydrobiopterin dehydratase